MVGGCHMSIKSNTSDVLCAYYKKHGLDMTIDVARLILAKSGTKGGNTFRATVNGELAETILKLTIEDFMLKHKRETKDWFIETGIILADPETKDESDYKTEIDVTLFTPQRIVTFECKSYSGDKIVKNACTVYRPKQQPKDIYAQHIKHAQMLLKNLGFSKIVNPSNVAISGVMLSYFDFSLGTIRDYRTEEMKKRMPVTTTANINNYLSCIMKVGGIVWDVRKIKNFFKIHNRTKEADTNSHLVYVKSLHH